MTKQKTLHIFLSQPTIWFLFAGKTRSLETFEKGLDLKKILEICHDYDANKIILFLEFPWVLTHFEITITLSTDELTSYAKMHLGFQDVPENDVQKFSTQESANSKSLEIPVGGIYFKQAESDRIGLLCATLSKEILALKILLKQELLLTVETVPLIVACVPLLMKSSENSMIFKGLEQTFFLEKKDGFLSKLVELPAFENISQELFVSDQLPFESKPQTFRLLPDETKIDISENKILHEKNPNKKFSSYMKNEIYFHEILTEWKGLSNSPKSGFWWASPQNNGWLKKVVSWWNLTLVLIIAIVAGAGIFYNQTLEQRKVLQHELSSFELELEKQRQNSSSNNYGIRKKHLEQLEVIAEKMLQEGARKQQAIQSILSSIEDAWLENFEFKNKQIRLELLALESINAVDLFLKLSKLPETESVHFKSQQKTKIKEHELIRFILLIKLAPPKGSK